MENYLFEVCLLVMGLDSTVKRIVKETSIRKHEHFQERIKDHTVWIAKEGIIDIHFDETHLSCGSGVQAQPNGFLA